MPKVATPSPQTREERIAQAERNGYRYAYGSLFRPFVDTKSGKINGFVPDYQIEAQCCRAKKEWGGKFVCEDGFKPKEYLGFVEHFKRFVSCIWHEKNPVLAFEWNPRAERIVEELFYPGRKFLGIAGGKSTSKTETLAIVAVGLFLINPSKTKCLMTAKTLKSAKGRNFGRVILAWQAAIHFFGKGDVAVGEKLMPGVLRDGIIEYRDGDFRSALQGIELVACDQGPKKAGDKIVGAKQEDGILFVNAEELATLPQGLVEVCRDNLAVNDGFLFAGPFNPRDHFDSSRLVAKPKNGYDSISVEDDGWETDLGYCLHFDNLKSPNVLAMEGERLWKGLYGKKDLEWDEKRHSGQNSPGFWQYVRGYWPPTGANDAIYSGQEITSYLGDKTIPSRECVWLGPTEKCAGLDPAYAPGGDRAVAYFGEVGWASILGETKFVLHYTSYKVLAADVTKGQDKSRQVAESYKEECEKRGVKINNAGVDKTGAASFASLLRMIWGDGFLEVDFAESATDTPIANTDEEDASEDYKNRRSQLWYSGKPLLRSGQLKGIGPDLASEMVTCMYKMIGTKVVVESKEDMKKRTGFSPDIAEAAWVCLSTAIERLGLVCTEKAGVAVGSDMGEDEWTKWVEQIQGCRNDSLALEYS